MKIRKNMYALGEYVGHLIIGVLMFSALMLFGGLLNLLVHSSAPYIGDDQFLQLMKLVERIILYGDVVFIVWWSVFSTYKAIKEMINE